MTDIVERLYEMADDFTPELAAQEITRLRAEIAVLRACLLKAEMKGELDDIEEVARLVAIGRREGIGAAITAVEGWRRDLFGDAEGYDDGWNAAIDTAAQSARALLEKPGRD